MKFKKLSKILSKNQEFKIIRNNVIIFKGLKNDECSKYIKNEKVIKFEIINDEFVILVK